MPQPPVLLDTSGGHSVPSKEVQWNGAPVILSSLSIAYTCVDSPGSGQTPLTLPHSCSLWSILYSEPLPKSWHQTLFRRIPIKRTLSGAQWVLTHVALLILSSSCGKNKHSSAQGPWATCPRPHSLEGQRFQIEASLWWFPSQTLALALSWANQGGPLVAWTGWTYRSWRQGLETVQHHQEEESALWFLGEVCPSKWQADFKKGSGEGGSACGSGLPWCCFSCRGRWASTPGFPREVSLQIFNPHWSGKFLTFPVSANCFLCLFLKLRRSLLLRWSTSEE